MSKFLKIAGAILFFAGLFGVLAYLTSKGTLSVLVPKGTIADQQRDLLVFATALMMVIIVPVFIMTITIAWKYRASNKKAKYSPEWDSSRIAEGIWWGFPILIILILASVTWKTTHDLDPYRPIQAQTKPLTVQVVALQWKWLFIYPDQNVASVNQLHIPVDTPINFEITSDAPMNSFWIPQLGGQVYAMSGMETKLHLMADEPGSYQGSSANISGEGFAGMNFTAEATSQEQFDDWVDSTKQSDNTLNPNTYEDISAPSSNNPVTFYALADVGLFDTIIRKFNEPAQYKEHTSVGDESHGHE